MANIPIYDGAPLWNANAVPFGFYSTDTEFQIDAVKVAKFCASRLGYPLVDVELQSGSFFTAFEEAVTTYGNELYAYIIRDNQLSLEGLTTESLLNTSIITPNFEPIVRLTEMYGAEAGSGGNVPYYTGSVAITASQQDYDLKQWAIDEGITGSIEIKRVFYQEPVPASAQYLDPYTGFGFGGAIAAGLAGVGGFGGDMGYLLMPLSYDMQVIQSIEMNEMIRWSNYSFELKNNKLRIFPIPNKGGGFYWFEYIKREERISTSVDNEPSKVSNVSNTPYSNPTYSSINSIGRQWIFEYTLALSKEVLGYVRGKYSTIPIPNAEVNLNQADLLAAATAEKTALIERLRSYFDETSRKSLLERRAQEADSKMIELQQVPWTIFIG